MSKQDSKNNKGKQGFDSPKPNLDISNSDLARMITQQGKTTQEQISQLGNELRDELGRGLESIKEDLVDVRTKVSRIEADVSANTDAISRSLLCHDLIISGVPYLKDEDLSCYFQRWCMVLGYGEASIPHVDIRRMTRAPIREGSSCFILVQFAIPNQRNDFFGRYLQQRSLTLSQVGFKSDKRIYINENLIPSARKIKSNALALKKEGKLNRVYTRGGIVYVGMPDADRDFAATTSEELERIVQKNTPFPH